jgi:AraC family transcriptional regulator of adaptative response/methylated-DNA-[protein]-cysteine methyltransferase
MKDKLLEQSQDYVRIERAIGYLEYHFQEQPSLDEIADSVHLSKYHFQRLFKRWAGVTPVQFAHYLTVEYAKQQLRESRSVFDTTLEAGLSSPSRLHDLFVTFEAMTPGEYKRYGKGLEILYGFHPTPFGECLLAVTARGICALRFVHPISKADLISQLKGEWPEAVFVEELAKTRAIVEQIFAPTQSDEKRELHLLLRGTNFQIQVWRALLLIPSGAMVSYQDVAGSVSTPSAAQAVGSAVAKNPIGYLIPCHRVINKVGTAHHYRWGATRKKAILGWEASRTQIQSVAN